VKQIERGRQEDGDDEGRQDSRRMESWRRHRVVRKDLIFFYLEVGHLQFWQMDPNILTDVFEIQKVQLWCFCICSS
jgi:hypothetical protein